MFLWCQVHSSHIHASHKTLNYHNSKQPGKKSLKIQLTLSCASLLYEIYLTEITALKKQGNYKYYLQQIN